MTERYRVKYLGDASPRPEICRDDYAMRPEEVAELLNALQQAVQEAHKIILREINAGRTPELLPKTNGGKGLGYFEDLLLPPGLAAEWDEAAMREVMSQSPAWAEDPLLQRVDWLPKRYQKDLI